MSTLFWPAFNLAILIGILIKYTRQPIKDFVRSRSELISKDLVETAGQKKDAEAKKNDLMKRLQNMTAETQTIVQESEDEAKASAKRILENAEKLATEIRTDAKESAGAASGDLKAELIEAFGIKLVEKVEALVTEKMTNDDLQKFKKSFTALVETTK